MTARDNLALVVLCSTLGYEASSDNLKLKPLTTAAYTKLEKRMDSVDLMPSVFLQEKLSDISGLLALTEIEIEQISSLLARADRLGEELDRLAEKKIYITSRMQDNYPTKLKKAMGKSAPVIFFYCGDINLLKNETVAIIGSREATDEEKDYTAKHARISAQNHRVIISGGARGVDTIAKEAALHVGGKVITFVSDNMTGYIEKNAEFILWDKMLALSSFHPDAIFQGYNALERNKYIYASSDYAVVVSSGDGTGGSYKGAADCLKKNYCPLYVKDNGISTEGNKKLIELGGISLGSKHERINM